MRPTVFAAAMPLFCAAIGCAHHAPPVSAGPAASKPQPTLILSSGLRSDLSREALMQVARSQRAGLQQLEGLSQKYYLTSPQDGTLATAMLWSSREAAAAYMSSAGHEERLAACGFKNEPRVTFFAVIDQLRPSELPAADAHPDVVVLVADIDSRLPPQQLLRVKDQRKPEFLRVPGLLQKYYLRDGASGTYGGLYVFASPKHAQAYRDSELRKTIASAYALKRPPQVQVLGIGARLYPAGDGARPK